MFQMQCFPLYSMLLAVGNPTVDYMSLDIEGAEYGVRALLHTSMYLVYFRRWKMANAFYNPFSLPKKGSRQM